VNDLQRRLTYGATLSFTHFQVTTYLWSSLINRTAQGVSIQGGTPAIIQTLHGHGAPFVSSDKVIGDAGIRNEHDLQTATAGLAVVAGNRAIGAR